MFICGGTFVGLEEIIKKRLGRKMIGFTSEQDGHKDTASEYSEVLSQVTPEDIVEYGMIPEMMGRLPILTTLEELDVEALVEILTEPKNALIKQYKKLFEMEDAELQFTDAALELIAEKAIERDTGARALRATLENLMIDIMYQLPDEQKGGIYAITEDIVQGKTDIFETVEQKKESA